MSVTELLAELRKLFPRLPAHWDAQFAAALKAHEGERLQAAFAATMQGWKKTTWPRPADIAARLPREGSPKPGERGLTEAERDAWAQTVMRSPAGQEALRGGYARELWIWAKRYPDAHPGPVTLQMCKDETALFLERIATIREEGLGRALQVARRMIEFEADLKRSYLDVDVTEDAA